MSFPVITTTSRLMSTGIDAQTCKLIVLDRRIASLSEFKQLIGRGTRINEDYDKLYGFHMPERAVFKAMMGSTPSAPRSAAFCSSRITSGS